METLTIDLSSGSDLEVDGNFTDETFIPINSPWKKRKSILPRFYRKVNQYGAATPHPKRRHVRFHQLEEVTSEIGSLAEDKKPETGPVEVADTDSDSDCQILDKSPFEDDVVDFKRESSVQSDEELAVLSEKGPVACRDYPHSRDICATIPFLENKRHLYCKMCHCYVCEVKAPCQFWGDSSMENSHCNASSKIEHWKQTRKEYKSLAPPQIPKQTPCQPLHHPQAEEQQSHQPQADLPVITDEQFVAILQAEAVQADAATGSHQEYRVVVSQGYGVPPVPIVSFANEVRSYCNQSLSRNYEYHYRGHQYCNEWNQGRERYNGPGSSLGFYGSVQSRPEMNERGPCDPIHRNPGREHHNLQHGYGGDEFRAARAHRYSFRRYD